MATNDHSRCPVTGWPVLYRSALLLLLLGCMLQSAAALRVLVKVDPPRTSVIQHQAEQHGFQVVGAAPGLLVLDRAAPAAHASAERTLLQSGRPGTRTAKRPPTDFKAEAIRLIKSWPGVQLAEVDQPRFLQRALRSISSATAPSAAHSSSSFGGCNDKELFAPGKVLPEIMPYGILQVQADSPKLPRDITSSGVMICVIDSGIDTHHPDQAGNMLDGCKAQDNVAPAGCPFNWGQDLLGHGTHVAGILAARQDGQGTVGVIPGGAELYSVRVFNDSGDVNQGQSFVYGSSLILAYTQCEGRLAAMQVGAPTLRGFGEQASVMAQADQPEATAACDCQPGTVQHPYPTSSLRLQPCGVYHQCWTLFLPRNHVS